MSILVKFSEFPFHYEMHKDSIRRRRRDPAQLPHIGIHDIVVGFQVLLNLVPTERGLIQFSIAHFITRIDGINE